MFFKKAPLSRTRSRNRRDRGNLTLTVLFIILLSGSALMLADLAQSNSSRVTNDAELEEASACAEAGINFMTECWRRWPDNATVQGSYPTGYQHGILWPTTTESDGWAELLAGNTTSTLLSAGPPAVYTVTCSDAAILGQWFPCGKGRFCVTAVQTTNLGSTGNGKAIKILGNFGKSYITWQATLTLNGTSPIQGVGTQSTQSWTGNSTFGEVGGGSAGTIFANGNVTISSPATANGSVLSAGTVTGSAQVSGGSVTQNGSTTDFSSSGNTPDTLVSTHVTTVQGLQNAANTWTNPQTALLAAANAASTKPTAMQVFNADTTKLGSGWSNTNTMNQSHVAIQGGNMTLPAGNYAFGRLYLDGTTLTITAPANGGYLVLPDIYLTNGARLIIDARAGEFTTVSGNNNAYQDDAGGLTGGSGWTTGTTNSTYNVQVTGQTYNSAGGTWTSGIASPLTITGDTSPWTHAGGGGPNAVGSAEGTKNDADMSGGDAAYYDDWLIRNNSVLATVTNSTGSTGMQVYNQSDVDLALVNGGNIIPGIQGSAGLAALQNTSNSIATLQGMTQDSAGFLYWSAGGGNPRFDVWNGDSSTGTSGNASHFRGLIYGAVDASWGTGSTLVGAVIGNSVRDMGATFQFDPTLTTFKNASAPNSNHAFAKVQVANPVSTILTTLH